MSTNTEVHCPLLIWTLTYVGVIVVGDFVLRAAADSGGKAWLAQPVVVLLAAVSVSATVLEVLLRRGWSCDWIEQLSGRLVVYSLAFVVGIFVLSGVTTRYNVPLWYRAVVIALFIAPLVALAATHSTHRLTRPLRLIACLPVVVLSLIIAALLFFAITNWLKA